MADWEVVTVHKKKKNSNSSNNKQQLFHDNVIRKYCTRLCRKPKQDHDVALCMQAHHDNDLRRCPFLSDSSNILCYSVTPCSNFPGCSKGNACSYAHTRNEVSYHPMVYKTKLCKRKQCDFHYCAFVHGGFDQRTPQTYEVVKQRERTISLTEYIPTKQEEDSKPEIIETIHDWTGWQKRFSTTILLPCPLQDVFSRLLHKYNDVRMKIKEICLSKTCTPFLNATNRVGVTPVMLLIQGSSNEEIYEAMESIEIYLQNCRPKLDDTFPPRFIRYLQNDQEGVDKLRDLCGKYKGVDISVEHQSNKVIVWGSVKKIRQDILYDLKKLSTTFALNDAKIIADAKLQSLEYELESTRKQLQEALSRQSLLMETLTSSESIISTMNSKLKVTKIDQKITPEEWVTTSGYNECLVPMNSVEWDKVHSSFMATIKEESGIRCLPTVRSITRIENHTLWKHYYIMKEEVHNEMALWHGTAYISLDPICKEGFNRSYAGQHATAFGEGTYFAKNSGYSYKFSRRESLLHARYMIQAKVLVGMSIEGKKGMKEPKVGDTRYHSAVNYMHRPTIFVVFKDYQAYPAYIIKFTSYN